jgi:hypothetical protein
MTRVIFQPTRISLTLVSEGGQRARHSVCVPDTTPDACIPAAAMVYGAAINQLADRMAVQRIQVERRKIQWNQDVHWTPQQQPAATQGVSEPPPLEMAWVTRQVGVELCNH